MYISNGREEDADPAPGELRGASIRNGNTQDIARDDVMVVPSGVPHQFLQVTNPFLYYVVKVR